MDSKTTLWIFLFICFTAVQCDVTCDTAYYPYTLQCSDQCCGTRHYRYCCWDYVYHANVGVIVGAVLGSIGFIVAVVSIIVIFCCCRRKSRAQAGQVYQNAYPMTTVSGIQTSNMGYGQTGYVNGAYPVQSQTTGIK